MMVYCEVATSMIARRKKPRHDLIAVLHLKNCGAAEKSLRGCIRRAIIEVATPRLYYLSDIVNVSNYLQNLLNL